MFNLAAVLIVSGVSYVFYSEKKSYLVATWLKAGSYLFWLLYSCIVWLIFMQRLRSKLNVDYNEHKLALFVQLVSLVIFCSASTADGIM